MNYYEHHLGDYMRDTAHLSMLEDGAYRRLIDAYYIAEVPFPDDKREVLKIARATTKAERDAVEYVLRKFFVYEAGSGWLHKRCSIEIARFQDKQRKARASAEARWSQSERNANASPNASPNAIRTHSERNADGMHRAPVPSPQSPDKEKPPKPPAPPSASLHRFPPGFETLWAEYPRKVGKDAAAKAFAKRRPDDALLSAMVAAVRTQRQSEQWHKDGGQFVPHLSTWLNEGRWMDEAPSATQPGDDVFANAK